MIFISTIQILKAIKHQMKLDGLKNQDIVDYTHKTKSTISRLMKQDRNIGIETLDIICKSLGYTLDIKIYNREGEEIRKDKDSVE